MTDSPVPAIDISPFARGAESDRDRVAQAVDRACTDIGFFAVTGHGVPERTAAGLRQAAVAFFALPESAKRAVERPQDRIARGWNAVGDRALARSLGRETPPDLQERFAIGPVDVPDGACFTCARARPFFAPNMWPAAQPELREPMEAYCRTMTGLCGTLMRICARALGRPEGFFDDSVDRHSSSLRLVLCPGEVAAGAGQRRAGARHGYGALTVLRGDNLPGGPQVRPRHGGWTDVACPEGGFVRAVGDAMTRWSDGRRTSTLHPVGLPAARGPDRMISIVFFRSPDYDARIRCVAGPGEPAKYPPADFDAFFVDKPMRGSGGPRRPASPPAATGDTP